jgi:TPP-dependent pyruvate/acetoin dehydrogenase alpha subunit
VLVVANNQYAYSTPTSRQFACESLVAKAVGYGMQGYHIDGTSLGVCLETLRTAISRARGGAGPQMVVADLLRLCGHGEHDDGSYVKAGLKTSSIGRDCVKAAEQELLTQGWADSGSLALWRAEAVEKVDLAVAQVQREAGPDPYEEDWCALATKELRDGFSSQVNNEETAATAAKQG